MSPTTTTTTPTTTTPRTGTRLSSGFVVLLLSLFHGTNAVFTVAEAKTLWYSNTMGLPTNYTYQYVETLSGTNRVGVPYILEIREDMVSNVYVKPPIYIDFGDAMPPPPIPSDFPTVDDLFGMIEQAEEAVDVTVGATYDAIYGYPTSLDIVTNSDTNTNTTADTNTITNTEQLLRIQVSNMVTYTLLEYELEEASALWEEMTTSRTEEYAGYAYTSSYSCFCMQDYVSPKRIQVDGDVNGTVLSTVDIETGLESEYSYDTIPELFDRIQRSIDRFHIQISVLYDSDLGYPTLFSSNPRYGIADGGTHIEISNVTLTMTVVTPTTTPSPSPSRSLRPVINNNYGDGDGGWLCNHGFFKPMFCF